MKLSTLLVLIWQSAPLQNVIQMKNSTDVDQVATQTAITLNQFAMTIAPQDVDVLKDSLNHHLTQMKTQHQFGYVLFIFMDCYKITAIFRFLQHFL